jgi:hypothetical protein
MGWKYQLQAPLSIMLAGEEAPLTTQVLRIQIIMVEADLGVEEMVLHLLSRLKVERKTKVVEVALEIGTHILPPIIRKLPQLVRPDPEVPVSSS